MQSRVGTALLLLALAPGCVAGVDSDPAAGGDDEAAVRAVVSAIDAGYQANDLRAAAANFAEDILFLPPGQPVFRGIEAVVARDSAFLATTTGYQYSSTVEEVGVSGGIAWVRTSTREAWTPVAGGEGRVVTAKALLLLNRGADGNWKLTHWMWNTTPAT